MYLYIHIPFCQSKCKYCKFASWSHISQVKQQMYVQYLCEQIESYPQHKKLFSIYFGGGTPSILTHDQLQAIFISLQKKFLFSKNIEITLESTPQNLMQENIIFWKTLGVNRVSVGVQSLHQKTLDEIGRVKKEDILQGIQTLFDEGVKNVSTDWIIGLPHTKLYQTQKDIQDFLQKFPKLQHISVYMLEDYYYPQGWHDLILSPEQIAQEYREIASMLDEKGFHRYEISNFAKTGYACRHNQAYWTHKGVIGFGLDAHGYEHSCRYAYPDTFTAYYKGEVAYKEKIDTSQKILEKIMFGLRTQGVDKKYFSPCVDTKLKELVQNGYLQFADDIYSITDKGIPVLDTILGEII